MINNKFLFNFAVSYSGGGFKRLYAYAKWFNQNGGAWFIIHPMCKSLITEFPNNHFFVVSQSKLQRLFRDCDYLKELEAEIGVPNVYYSYGIPIYYKLGRLNWFHLSNVLPLGSQGIPLPLFDKLKLSYLGRRIENNFKNADIVSAESSYSLSLIKSKHPLRFFVSVNGSDDEILFYNDAKQEKKEKIAVVLGTYRYKALADSYAVFEMLHAKDNQLKLMIIGDDKKVPKSLRMNPNIILKGSLPRDKVVDYLRQAEFYISTTYIENSYNAASEGIFFAKESYISDIAPHRELVAGLHFEEVSIPNLNRPLLRLKREEISPVNLKTWDNVITEMVEHMSKNNTMVC
ncbi:glycosyltransferase [Legionella maioricensis]|uniref:Glycosyltransferase n=1 Tax=Legionella maioricensis TaxID=2896528 RepID=A0A9X2CZB5_9GAMM|nr:glycosyltransferase [Legionella maioricensis]MCL9683548.1 glycosyltransferase [Legionella maioricensis]MCL9686847.1 glycosyltransferase [Legionella maioricensis]